MLVCSVQVISCLDIQSKVSDVYTTFQPPSLSDKELRYTDMAAPYWTEVFRGISEVRKNAET